MATPLLAAIVRYIARLRTAVRSQRTLLVVIGATLAGVTVPALSTPLQPLLPALVAGLIFTGFYGFSVDEAADQRVSTPVVVSLACLYLFVPVALYPLASVALSGEMLLGVLVVLSAPLAAGSSIIWTRLSGGNTVLTTVVVLASMGIAPLAMPSLIALLADSAVEVSASELVVELAAIVLAGGALAYAVPGGTVSEDKLDDFSVATIGVLIYAGVGGSTLAVEATQLAAVGAVAIGSIALSAAVAYGLYARGMRSDDCITVLFSSSMKNMSVSVMVGAVIGGGTVVASITAFYVVQQVVSSSLVRHLEGSVPGRS
ncbi:bile acid:sodium symporter [Natronococcus sp. JC468]|uniref:bile acid:sodium symporter n=1 Tax=Natronococcus sp. JC468 TaxID=1961921 RepID=UPI0028AA4E01|nr:bile acid:sodium symporter [Natronococcus sp. JC468]